MSLGEDLNKIEEGEKLTAPPSPTRTVNFAADAKEAAKARRATDGKRILKTKE